MHSTYSYELLSGISDWLFFNKKTIFQKILYFFFFFFIKHVVVIIIIECFEEKF